MRVQTLIDLLQTVDPDLHVVISTDPEGNGFYALSQIDDLRYVESPVDRWYHEDTYEASEITEYNDDVADEPYIYPGYEKVLILWA